MPQADRKKVHDLVPLRYSNPAGKSALNTLVFTLFDYVRDRYTSFKYSSILEPKDQNAIAEILKSWSAKK